MPDERRPAVVVALLIAAVAFAVALLQWGQVLNWDELEFARATRWVAEGRVPFRDFWEHHVPLQWLLFAPVAAIFDGAGTGPVIALRWAQVPMWIAIVALLAALMRRANIGVHGRWVALLLLLTSLWFVRAAVQYRIDVPGHLALLGGLWCIVQRRWPWLTGVLLSLAVLANMRLAPLVIVTVLLAAFWRADEERWRWNADAIRIAASGVLIALVTIASLRVAGAWPGFVEGVLWYNRSSDQLLPDEARSFFARLITPFVQLDPAGALFLLAAIAGLLWILRDARRPGAAQFLALVAAASLGLVAATGIQYEYHFQTTLLLLVPAAASVLDRLRNVHVQLVAAIAGVALALHIAAYAPDFGRSVDDQNQLMLEIDRRTKTTDRVWDSAGYAMTREPAYRYWFLPAGVRFLADRKLIPDYDIEQLAANPPAAIVATLRTQFWLSGRPRLARQIHHAYVPLHQHLWIPGMSGIVHGRASWTVARGGVYDLYASEPLAKHPWFSRPERYLYLRGAELTIPLDRLPAARVVWSVDGVRVAGTTLELKRGARLEVESSTPVGVVAVPHGIRTLSRMPEGSGPF